MTDKFGLYTSEAKEIVAENLTFRVQDVMSVEDLAQKILDDGSCAECFRAFIDERALVAHHIENYPEKYYRLRTDNVVLLKDEK